MTAFSFSADGDQAHLAGRVDFDSAVALEQTGRRWLQQAGSACGLNLAALDYGNSALLAVLLSWQRQAQAQGKQLTVAQMPDNLHALADVCGLSPTGLLTQNV